MKPGSFVYIKKLDSHRVFSSLVIKKNFVPSSSHSVEGSAVKSGTVNSDTLVFSFGMLRYTLAGKYAIHTNPA